jgi:GNAT superfamily N-acetyltransferase
MKSIVIVFLLSFSFIQSAEFVVQPTQPKDLIRLKDLSKKVINEHFRKSLVTGYPDSPIAQNQELLETYLKSMTEGFSTIFEEDELKNTKQVLLTAVDLAENKIIGFSFSQRLNENKAYIRYIIVDENYRDKGIGSALLQSTLNAHEDISSCELKTLAYGNEKAHAFYKKHGFIIGKCQLPAPLAHQFCEHSDTITFTLYHLDIANNKKQCN